MDARCLTKQERTKIERYIHSIPVRLLVQHRNGAGDTVLGASYHQFQTCGRPSTRTIRYSPHLGPVEWIDLPVFLFEEDCAWAILEKLTDIVTNDVFPGNEKKHRQAVNRTFRNWIKPLRKAVNFG